MSEREPMTPDRWQDVKALFHDALDLPGPDRTAFVRNQTTDDPALCEEVLRLLDSHDDGTDDGFLDKPAAELSKSAFQSMGDDDADPLIGRTIGSYTIKSVIGHGGMGVVYRAQQLAPRRDVALKIVRPGMANPVLIQRFEREAFLLGRVQHAGIVKVYELGSFQTDLGEQPFIAMEFVDGVALMDAAAERAWSIDDQIRIMIKVSTIIQHAHQRGILHRDLKPGNILIDSDDEPHVLDFGIARLVGDHQDEHDTQTVAGQLLGTMQYMSPEQIDGDHDAIDTRSDVYALGVMLFEFLTGVRPFDARGTRRSELPRRIREGDRVKASVRNPACVGDLDIIIDTAMDTDANRRYQSAAALADDLQRVLDNRPISARADSTMYVFKKWYERKKSFIQLAAALVVALVVTIPAIIYLIGKSGDEESRKNFIADTIIESRRANLEEGIGVDTPPLPSLEEIAELSALYEVSADIDPIVRANLARLIGELHLKRNQYLEAEDYLRAAYDQFAQSDDDPLRLADLAYLLGRVLSQQWELEDAIELYEQSVMIRSAELPTTNGDLLRSMNDLAVCQRRLGQLIQAEETLRRLVSIRREHFQDEPFWIAASLNNLGTCLKSQGRFNEARQLYEDAEAIITEQVETNPIYVARCSRNIAECDIGLGNYASAEERLHIARNGLLEVPIPDHADIGRCLVQLATAAFENDRADEATAWIRQADNSLSLQTAFARPHPTFVARDFLQVRMLIQQRRYGEADTILNSVAKELKQLVPDTHPFMGRFHVLRGRCELGRQRVAKAQEAMLLASAVYETRELAPQHPDRLDAARLHAEILARAGRLDDARAHIRETLDAAHSDLSRNHWILRQLRLLLDLYDAS